MDIAEYKVETGKEKQNHPWEYARFHVVMQLMRKHVPADKPITVADVGCGDAFFAGQFVAKYPNSSIYAVDTAFTPEILDELKSKNLGNNISFYNNIQEVNADKPIDFILLLDVIEHIEDDIDFLKQLKQMPGFNEHTIVVISVPAFKSLFCSNDHWLGHYRRYTSKMLIDHVNQADYSAVSNGYFFTSLLFPRFLKKTKERMFGYDEKKNQGIGEWTAGKGLSSIVSTVLRIDFACSKILRIIGIKLPGLSCYCLCKSSK